MKFLTYLKLRVAEHSLKRIQSEIAAAWDYGRALEKESADGHLKQDDLAREMREVGAKLVALEEEQTYMVARIVVLSGTVTQSTTYHR